MNDFIDKILISQEEIQSRVKQLAQQISQDYVDKEIRAIGILRGAFIFMSDLIRNISVPLSVDFMSISSYGDDSESGGVIRILKDLDKPIHNKHVLIIEDIVDTGLTLQHLKDVLTIREPASLKVCALLDKQERRIVKNLEVEYTGFVIPDQFVVGYGLDFAEKYRNYPFIFVLKSKYYQTV
jgi:hypoxanthine phosphoribosyltransferase